MLILTRRKNQKVVFPSLGITVKVVDVSGKTIRLGIDAPKEIRVVRDELEPLTPSPDASLPDASSETSASARPVKHGAKNIGNPLSNFCEQSDCENLAAEKVEVLVRRLDAANLALHLAQNQLRQGHHEFADESLQHAIECLQEIESAAGLIPSQKAEAVHEAPRNYTVNKRRTALLLDGNPDDRRAVEKQLSNFGMTVSNDPNISPLDKIAAIQDNDRPDLILILAPTDLTEMDQAEDQSTGDVGDESEPIRLGSLNTLACITNVNVAGRLASAWTANDFCLSQLLSQPESNAVLS